MVPHALSYLILLKANVHTGKLRHRISTGYPSSPTNLSGSWNLNQNLVPFQSDWAKQIRCSQHWTNQCGLEVGRHGMLEVALALLPGKSQEETQCDPLHCHPLGSSRESRPLGKPPSSQLGASILLTFRTVPGTSPPPLHPLPPANSLEALSPTGGLPWGSPHSRQRSHEA